jgi:ribose transport system permease protein
MSVFGAETSSLEERGRRSSPPAEPPGGGMRWSFRDWDRLLIELFGIGGFYLAVIVFFSTQVDGFLSTENLQAILAGATVLGLVAVGQTLVIISGGFDLSVGGMVALGAVMYGVFFDATGFVPAVLLTLAIGAAVGLINGVLIARLKISALIGTLAMLSVTGGAAYIIANGKTTPLTGADAGFWGETGIFGLQYGTLALIVLALVATFTLRHTIYGRSIYTIGGNSEAALLAGLRVEAISISVYMLSGACAAFGGAVAASELLAASPNTGGDTTLNSVAAVVLGGASLSGGVGGVPGSLLGVLLLGTTTTGLGLMQVPSFYQTIVTGLVLLVAVLFGRVRDLLVARRRRLARPTS